MSSIYDWYIAGPMRGVENFNFPAFMEAHAHLAATHAATSIFNPAYEDKWMGYTSQEMDVMSLKDFLKRDIPALLYSSNVLVLPGWRNSEGASLEVTIAQRVGIPVYEYDGIGRPLVPIEAVPTAHEVVPDKPGNITGYAGSVQSDRHTQKDSIPVSEQSDEDPYGFGQLAEEILLGYGIDRGTCAFILRPENIGKGD